MICKGCKKDFLERRKKRIQRFCTQKCYKHFWYRMHNPKPKRIEKFCVICKKTFIPFIFHPKQITCSKKCSKKAEYIKNKSSYINRVNIWRKQNPEKVRAIHRRHYKKYIEKMRLAKRVRNTAKISSDQWIKICEKHNNICQLCYKTFDISKLTIDHIKPISKGGGNEISNLQPMCAPCNARKGNRFW